MLATQISLESIHSDHTEVNSDHASEDIPVEEIIEAVEDNDTGIKSNHIDNEAKFWTIYKYIKI